MHSHATSVPTQQDEEPALLTVCEALAVIPPREARAATRRGGCSFLQPERCGQLATALVLCGNTRTQQRLHSELW